MNPDQFALIMFFLNVIIARQADGSGDHFAKWAHLIAATSFLIIAVIHLIIQFTK